MNSDHSTPKPEAVEAAAAAPRRPRSAATWPSARSRPIGSAGRRRCSCRVDSEADLAEVAAAVAGDRGRRAGRREGLEPARRRRGFAGLASCSATSFADGRGRRARVVPGRRRRLPCRCVARRTAAAGLTGLRVGGGRARLDRRRGAHERRRPRLRHGRVAAEGPRASTCARGEDGVVAAERARARATALGARPVASVVVWARAGAGPRRPAGGRGRDRRDRARGGGSNQPGGQNAGSVFTNPAGRLRRPADRRRRAARACASAPPRCRRSTPTSSRPTTGARPTTWSR